MLTVAQAAVDEVLLSIELCIKDIIRIYSTKTALDIINNDKSGSISIGQHLNVDRIAVHYHGIIIIANRSTLVSIIIRQINSDLSPLKFLQRFRFSTPGDLWNWNRNINVRERCRTLWEYVFPCSTIKTDQGMAISKFSKFRDRVIVIDGVTSA